ncbi:outer membrane protein assembly factor BamB family protein [Dyadobacter luticola]|nr:PQQ-binding-like beta-propeller repeat protein [Dyadobacter luticola]
MKLSITFVLMLSGLLACNPDNITTQTDKDGVVTQQPFLWKSSISDGTLAYGLYHGYVIDGKGVLSIAIQKSADPKVYGDFYLQLKDVNTGENIWIWDDFYKKQIERTFHGSIVVNEGKLLLHDRYSDYCINYQTGKTVWKSQRGFFSSDGPTNIGNNYFISGIPPTSKDHKKIDDSMFMGDLNSEKITEVIKPSYSDEFTAYNGEETYIGSIYRHKAFLVGTETMLLIPYDEIGPQVKYNNTRSFFGLYNYSKNTWVYKRAPLSIEEDGSSPSLMPIIDHDKVFLTSFNSVGCFDLLSGKRIWQYRMTSAQMMGLDIIKAGNKLIINGTDGTIYCMDAGNGAMLWSKASTATNSDLYHQDGILYCIRGDNLRAYDLQNGKLLWDMPSLDARVENNRGSIFNGFVTGIPAQNGRKGRIFVSTELNVYCFEAVN